LESNPVTRINVKNWLMILAPHVMETLLLYQM